MSLLYSCDPGTLQSALVVLEQTPRGTLMRYRLHGPSQ